MTERWIPACAGMTEETDGFDESNPYRTLSLIPHRNGRYYDKFAPGVVQICHSYSCFSVIFALGVVQYFYEGGSNLDP